MITGYFGLPGCGKSTFLAKLAHKYLKQGRTVYVLAEHPVDGCTLFQWQDLGRYDMSNSVILIDEISLRADNRDFKAFPLSAKQFFILHRHYSCDIVWFTQQYDGVDRKIRELTVCLFYIRSTGSLSYAFRVNRFILIHKEEKDIRVGYKISNIIFILLFWWFSGSAQFCYRPFYYKYFDSWNAPALPLKDFPVYHIYRNSSLPPQPPQPS